MGKLQDEYNKIQLEKNKLDKINKLNSELKLLENIAKSGMIDEKEKEKLRKAYKEVQKEIEGLSYKNI